MRGKFNVFSSFIYLTSVISFIVSIIFFENYDMGYKTMAVYPLIYMAFYFLIYRNLRKTSLKITLYGVIGMEWLRFVLMPPICAMAGANAGLSYINPTYGSLTLATMLTIYEFCIITFVSFFLLSPRKKHNIKINKEKLSISGNKMIYFIFILLVIVILLTVGRNNTLINFIYIPVSSSERLGDLTDTFLVLARQVVIVGLFILFLWTVNYCKSKYEKSYNNIYVYFSIFIALVNVSVIVGERRTSQIYTAFLSMWILMKTFPRHKKRILFSVGSTASLVLILMSIYKFFAAFQYNSYAVAMSNSSIDVSWLSRTLQSYFFGPENIAAVLDFSKLYDIKFSNIVFDLFRSIFGLSFLVKGQGVLTSEAFNTFIYGTTTSTGHVISAVGYGYIFFGTILSPLIAIINITISSKIEKRMYVSRSYEMTYVWGYILVRFSTNLFVNTLPLISSSTIMLGTGGVLFLTAFLLNKTGK